MRDICDRHGPVTATRPVPDPYPSLPLHLPAVSMVSAIGGPIPKGLVA